MAEVKKLNNTALPKNIKIDYKDPLNTEPKESTSHNFWSNFRPFASGMTKTVLRSKLFWILLIVLPMFVTFLEYMMIVSIGTDGFEHIFLASFWNTAGNPNVPPGWPGTPFANGVGLDLVKMVRTDIMNYFMIIPMILLNIIIFPTFISNSREDNMLKRMRLIGTSRSQLYWYYMIYSFAFIALLWAFWLGIWVNILAIMAGQIAKVSNPEIFANGKVINDNYFLFKRIEFNTMNGQPLMNLKDYPFDTRTLDPVTFGEFGILLILSTLAMISYGFKKSMKTKSSKNLLNSGIGLWIFSIFTSGMIQLIVRNVFDATIIANSVIINGIFQFGFFVLGWLFLLTWVSLFNGALTIAMGFVIVDPFSSYPGDEILLGVEIFAAIAALWLIGSTFIIKDKIISFETTR